MAAGLCLSHPSDFLASCKAITLVYGTVAAHATEALNEILKHTQPSMAWEPTVR